MSYTSEVKLPEFYDLDADIAVVGASGEFPGAGSIDEFWQNLLAGKCAIADVSEDALLSAGIPESVFGQTNYVRKTASIRSAKYFDPVFFGLNQAEARLLDPQHRIFLQHAWLALENAGFIPDEIAEPVGVYAGCGMNRYLLSNLSIDTREFDVEQFQKMLANEKDFLATRVSHKLNLRGPSINVQSACSTSLLAVQLGVLSLQTYQCDVALCGGVAINSPHDVGYISTEGMIFSPSGQCRPFTANADGTLFGEGVGVVVLKRLAAAIEDGDDIWAVVKGAATNNDGSDKVGFTAPSVSGQSEVIQLAQDIAGVSAQQIQFLETHGTATSMGDPIELEGLHRVFGEAVDSPFCALGALKSNIGHLDAAAGIAAFIKTVLVARYKMIPPALAYGDGEPAVSLQTSPFYFNEQILDLRESTEPMLCGVSSFGVGGTNVHAIVASPPHIKRDFPATDNYKPTLHLISAKSSGSAITQQTRIADYLQQQPENSASCAYTLATVRKRFSWRTFLIANPQNDGPLLYRYPVAVQAQQSDARLVMAFTGQGAQYRSMTQELYQAFPLYRQYIDQGLELLDGIGQEGIRDVLFGNREEPLTNTAEVQLCLFLVEYSLACLLLEWGLAPTVLVGHSLGEYVAAAVAGVFSLKDALRIVSGRGRLMAGAVNGIMVAVFCGRKELQPYLDAGVEIAVENSPQHVVVAGLDADMDAICQRLSNDHVVYTRLNNAHPFHTHYMDGVLEQFARLFEGITLRAPTIPVLPASATSTENAISTTDYWVNHLRQEVNFHVAIEEAVERYDVDTVLEVGPGSGLCSFFKATCPDHDLLCIDTVPNVSRAEEGQMVFAQAVGALWCRGISIDLEQSGLIPEAARIELPGYAFAEDEYWLTGHVTAVQSVSNKGSTYQEKLEDIARHDLDRALLAVWRSVLGVASLSIDDNFIELGGDSVVAVQLIKEMHRATGLDIAPSELFAAPTIRSLLDSEQAEDHPGASVVQLNRSTEGEPMFCLCGVQVYKEFADGFDDRPVYGMYADQEVAMIRCEEEGRPAETSIESLVEAYVDGIERQMCGNSLSLAGLSFGGLLALEVARVLIARGYNVNNIIMFDSYLTTSHRRSVIKTVLDIKAAILRRGLAGALREFAVRLAKKLGLVSPEEVEWSSERGEEDRNRAFRKIASRYDPTGQQFNFDVLLIKAALHDMGFGLVGKADYGLRRVIKGQLKVASIKAGHVELIAGNAVKEVHAVVAEYLKREPQQKG